MLHKDSLKLQITSLKIIFKNDYLKKINLSALKKIQIQHSPNERHHDEIWTVQTHVGLDFVETKLINKHAENWLKHINHNWKNQQQRRINSFITFSLLRMFERQLKDFWAKKNPRRQTQPVCQTNYNKQQRKRETKG